MRITITGQTQKHMDCLCLSKYPFTSAELKSHYRLMVKQYHTDVSKDPKSAEKIKDINIAYEYLEAFALIDEMNTEETLRRNRTIEEEDPDIFSKVLTDVCPDCKGEKVIRQEIHPYKERCWKCNAMSFLFVFNSRPGWVALKCRDCKGSGKFELRNGNKVSCRKCKGTGTYWVRCNQCNGKGFYWPYGEEPTIKTSSCSKCNGTGKIKLDLFNPVIPKGAVL